MAHTPDGTAFDLFGPIGAPPVVLIHGLGLNRQITWENIAPRLSEKYRVLSYDLPGHGDSKQLSDEVTLTSLGQQLLGLMDYVGFDRAVLVGFSLGGMINRRVALDTPEKVSALVVLNSPHERGPELQATMEQNARESAAGGPEAVIDTLIARWFTPEFQRRHAKKVAEVREVILSNDKVNYAAHRWVLARGVTELIRPMPPLRAPSLVMTCENDTGSTPAMSHEIAAEIAGSRVRIVPGLQHLGLLEDPDAFVQPIQEFLSQTIRT